MAYELSRSMPEPRATDYLPSARELRKMKAKHQKAFVDLEETDRLAALPPTRSEDHLPWWTAKLDPPHQWVYVIAEEASDAIKVGVATDFEARLESLQCGNPHTLELLCVFPAGYELEARIHRRLAPDRIHGEWFEGPTVQKTLPELEQLAQKMVDAYDDSGVHPSWKGHLSWLGNRHYRKPRRKPGEVTVRRVDPNSL